MGILIVDDDPALAEALALHLNRPDRSVFTAYTIERARALFLERDPDLVITDVCMTGHNDREGLTLLDWVKTLKPGLDVVVISGYGTTETEKLTRKYGGLRFFHKPLDLDILEDLVRNLFVLRAGTPPDREGSSYEPLNDARADQLRRDYLTGSEQALHALLAGYRAMVFSIGLNWYGLGPEEAEDVYQETCIEVMVKISRIRRIRPFIVGTAMNLCKKKAAERGRMRKRAVDEQAADQVPTPPQVVEEPGEVNRLPEALARLDEPSRKLLHLLFVEDLPYVEIARLLDIPIGSIGPLRMRALKKLKNLLGAPLAPTK